MDIDSFRDIVVYNFGYSANDDMVDYIANELVEDSCDSSSSIINDGSETVDNELYFIIEQKQENTIMMND